MYEFQCICFYLFFIPRRSDFDEEMLKNAHLFFYLADEGGNALTLGGGVKDIHETSTLASGLRADVGNWQLHLKAVVCYHLFSMKSFRHPT